MAHFEHSPYVLPSVGTDNSGFNSVLQNSANHQDETVSTSSAEDGSSYLAYPDPHKQECEVDDDANLSLTSQSLNADGTPKRPMNAFMIFARRRRPQVSAENQSMRTGEISKILSREWNSMESAEKQFYLDQAKQLKETFNSKYPDYVYRRRPNNSRKRRRTDPATLRYPDSSGSTEAGDDASAGTDPSSVDCEDLSSPDTIREATHSRLAHSSSPCSDINLLHPNQISYRYSLDEMNRQQLDNRSSYSTSAHKRLGQNLPSAPSHHSARFSETSAQPNYHQPRGSVQAGSQSHSAYFTDRNAVWDPIRAEHPAQLSAPSWSGNQERVLASGPVGPNSQNHSSLRLQPGLSSSHSQPYSFPTLNSPFFPNPSHVQSTFLASGSSLPAGSSSAHYPSSSLEGLAPRQSGRHLASSYDPCTYDLSPSFCSSTPFSRDTGLYGEPARSSRALQTSQPAPYTHSLQLVSPIASGSSTASNLSYWSKDRMSG